MQLLLLLLFHEVVGWTEGGVGLKGDVNGCRLHDGVAEEDNEDDEDKEKWDEEE